TAIANLYRAGLAAQAVFNSHSRKKTTMVVGIITMIVACFPFVFSQILPLLTYAGLLVVPVGGIVFAEHQIFPKIGYTRYWSHYKQLTFSTPAIVSWGLGLVFGFGLNIIDVMPFYYLFLPTWLFTIIIYTLLAGKYGAKESYPVEELKEKVRNENIEAYQEQKAEHVTKTIKDHSLFSKILGGVALISLAITLVLACNVLFGSADENIYINNREIFYRYAFVCTLIYFVTAYWKLKRGKNKNI
ncbi:hypothetical protein, partial [Formosa algae]